MSTRVFESGPGFVRAKECPDCNHTRCSEDCVCNCDAARAEVEADHWRMRAEKAEAKYTELRATSIEKLRLEESARAEKAEVTVDELSRELTEEIEAHRLTRERAEKAEARLSELVSELRECVRTCGGNSALFAILDEYEGGEHG